MLQNYLKIGLRNLLKHRSNTIIHVLGLAIGLATFLLINQYVVFEKSYDRFHTNANQLYRVTVDLLSGGTLETQDANIYAPASQMLVDELPEVIASTTSRLIESMTFQRNGKSFSEDILAADENFLKLFDYEILAGDPENLLKEPSTVVLTKSYAKKYFGNEDPIGKTIEYVAFGSGKETFKVTGIVADPPVNTHYSFNMITSLSSTKKRMERDGWSANNYYGYILLDEKADLAAVNKKLPELARKYMEEDGSELINLQPVVDIHLHSNMTFEPTVHGNSRAVNFLQIISIFILLIAWINYINLSTARAVERAKEVGMRKVIGARKSQLIGQFFTESVVVNLLAVVLAFLLVYATLPSFNQLVGKAVLENIWTNTTFLSTMAIFFLVGTLVTGIYPALVLSSFKPIGVLKGSFSKTKKGVWLRKNLVIFQFAASFALIAGTLVVFQQLRYMTNQEMGMNIDQVLSFPNPDYNGDDKDQFISKFNTFKNSLLANADIEEISTIASLPGGSSSDISSWDGEFNVEGISTVVKSIVYLNFMDHKTVDALELDLIAGRTFQEKIISDTNTILINRAMVKRLNIADPASVIDKFLVEEGGSKFRILGVLDDYNRSSLKHSIEPTIFLPDRLSAFSVVKLDSKNIPATIAKIEDAFLTMFPGAAFNPLFLDQKFEKLYSEDKRFASVFTVFSILAIFVAVMGLFGLASFLSSQRTKEIGIRKVLGASIPEIVFMFFKDFILLIGIGLLIGAPLIYWSMTEWLNGYAFRIDFPWWSMVLSVGILVIVSFLTISLHSLKVARMNPVESIKQER
ncbi:MAG: FtsX-like permease family protein [Saprospiraceae bacterium]